jgi:hypothetical protein
MSDDDEIDPHLTNGRRSHAMDEAFCARTRAAIKAGLERAPIIAQPSFHHPRYAIRPCL